MANENNNTDTKKNATPFQKEIYILLIIVFSVLCMFSFANMCGVFGKLLSALIFGLIGVLGYFFPISFVALTIFCVANKENKILMRKVICGGIMTVVFMAILQLLTYHFDGTFDFVNIFQLCASQRAGGGLVGGMIGCLLAYFFGEWGAYVILLALLAVGFMFITEKLLFHSLKRKSNTAYIKMKEHVEETVKERALNRQQEELEQLEDDDMVRNRPQVGLHLPFFNFKKESQEKKEVAVDSVIETENPVSQETEIPKKEEKEIKMPLLQENTIISKREKSSVIDQITVDFSKDEMEEESGETEEDPFPQLIIRRAEDLESQEEVLQEAEPEPDATELDEFTLSQEVMAMEEEMQNQQERENALVSVAEAQEEKAPVQRDYAFERQYKPMEELFPDIAVTSETAEGIVMEAEESAVTQLPEDAIAQLDLPLDKIERKAQLVPNAEASEGAMQIAVPVQPKEYVFPTIDLLTKSERQQEGVSDATLKESAKKLQDTLESFGVGAKVTNASCGPTVTRFELQPDQGVKVGKITALADDIKLNMAAEEIRIEAPIPGKAAVGIEVPNPVTSTVHFRDLVENPQFQAHKSKIAFAVGKDIGGKVIVTDIAKMPHLLIAGATGSGKSVCINTLIMSILYKAHPADVKLIMIDPKVVELSCYNGIPHLLIPVVTDPKKASAALQWAVQEMTERYHKFAELGVREANAYNKKITKEPYASDPKYQKLPKIVIIVDELADLMMVASKEVETAIARLAQLARAAGIHLVIATQRPSVNVITGTIKANVPSRIAFAVSSAVDSRTIIDGGGAEKLLGKGDMLFYPTGMAKPVRVQGAFVSDEEVNRIVEFIKSNNDLVETEETSNIENKIANVSSSFGGSEDKNQDTDDYFEQAGKFIIEKNKASIGMLQRVYKIGFNRAARIMDQLCVAGVVGPEEGTKPRKILMTMEEFEQSIGKS